jgi:hypothetical protein
MYGEGRAVLTVADKKEACAYRDQFPVTFQQYVLDHFLWDKHISECCICDILGEKK